MMQHSVWFLNWFFGVIATLQNMHGQSVYWRRCVVNIKTKQVESIYKNKLYKIFEIVYILRDKFRILIVLQEV